MRARPAATTGSDRIRTDGDAAVRDLDAHARTRSPLLLSRGTNLDDDAIQVKIDSVPAPWKTGKPRCAIDADGAGPGGSVLTSHKSQGQRGEKTTCKFRFHHKSMTLTCVKQESRQERLGFQQEEKQDMHSTVHLANYRIFSSTFFFVA
jgi:hypothetical protein